MAFSRALLDGQVSPLQLAALIRALVPAYAHLERRGPLLAASLGATDLPWDDLARSAALRHDEARLAAAGVPLTPTSPAALAWLAELERLADQAPHRWLAHLYVRYGGDLSGGQQLAEQAQRILAAHGLSNLEFWAFARPTAELKQGLHDAFEQLALSPDQEEELLAESEAAFVATQRLLAELADLAPEPA
jgi:heme oxygenase